MNGYNSRMTGLKIHSLQLLGVFDGYEKDVSSGFAGATELLTQSPYGGQTSLHIEAPAARDAPPPAQVKAEQAFAQVEPQDQIGGIAFVGT